MEFATVRNNVYKLKVTNINRWGNPGDKPTDPDDPDENPEVYFRVRVEVLPWVVRINNIEL
ncbi:MAG: fimbria major subunit, partial [Muribaculaceae bacterium]|nr:fimbria major subunit [Muribaculaceae bacterium]